MTLNYDVALVPVDSYSDLGPRAGAINEIDLGRSYGQNEVPLIPGEFPIGIKYKTTAKKIIEVGMAASGFPTMYQLPVQLSYRVFKPGEDLYESVNNMKTLNEDLNEQRNQYAQETQNQSMTMEEYFEATQPEIATENAINIRDVQAATAIIQEIDQEYTSASSAPTDDGGYTAMIEISVGDVGPDATEVRLCDTEGTLMSIPVYLQKPPYRPRGFNTSFIEDYEVEFDEYGNMHQRRKERSREVANKNYLANQVFHYYMLLNKPDTYLYVLVADSRGRDHIADMKMIQLDGLKGGQVRSSGDMTTDEYGKEHVSVTTEHEDGTFTQSDVLDYSPVTNNEQVILAKTDADHGSVKGGNRSDNINDRKVPGATSLGKDRGDRTGDTYGSTRVIYWGSEE